MYRDTSSVDCELHSVHEIDTSLLKITLLMRRKINIHYKE